MVVFGKEYKWSWGKWQEYEEGQNIVFPLDKDMEASSFIYDTEA